MSHRICPLFTYNLVILHGIDISVLCCTASLCINFPDFKFTIELSFKGHLLPRIRESFGDLSEVSGWGDLGALVIDAIKRSKIVT